MPLNNAVKQCHQTMPPNNTVKRQIAHNTHQAANSKADHKEKTQMSEMKNTLNVGRIEEGFVLDHIQAGKSMDIYKYLHLDKLDCCVAIIKNARSSKMGRKDIIKIECPIDYIDLDILGFIDHNITVNIIKDSRIVEKMDLKLPKSVVNVIKCKNPRCITSVEQELDQIFILTDEEKEVYRCRYCEEQYYPNK